MQIFLTLSADAIIACFIMLPIFWWQNQTRFHDIKRTTAYLIFATYLSGVYAVVGLPDIAYVRFSPNINLEPFLYMFSDRRSSILNVLLFIPLGLLLPILWADFRSLWKTLLVGFLTSLTVELLQIFTYRATDVNDLMTNTAGTLVGFCVGRVIQQLLLPDFPQRSRRHIPLIFGIAFLAMFFLHPFVSQLIYGIFT